jgi:NitT/TauT family transport system permease protein
MRTPAATSTASEERTAFGWVDAVVLLAIFGLLWSVLHFGRGMLVHFDESQMPQLSTNLGDIPYYAGRTVLRMWIAFTFSLLFTLTVGYAAAKNRTARAFILPARHASRFAPARHRCAGRMAPRAAHRGLVARSPGGGGI